VAVLVSAAALGGGRAAQAVKEASAALGASASLLVHVTLGPEDRAEDARKELRRAVLVGGLVDVQEAPAPASAVACRASKPGYAQGAKAALSLGAGNAPKRAAVWTLAADDDDELIDEDTLLTESDKRAQPIKYDDCEYGSGGRKACKNCTCGRADMDGNELPADQNENPQSACGSCGLGDAYRCATCPYRGMPAFEPGQKVELSKALLEADV